MNSKKGLLKSLVMLAVFIIAISIASVSHATPSSGKILNLKNPTYRASGYAYKAGLRSTSATTEQHMWKIYEYNTSGGSVKNLNNAIYCLKMGVGFGSVGGSPTQEKTYDTYADMKNPAVTATSDDRIIINNYISTLPGASTQEKQQQYNSLVWVLDHCYVPAPFNSPTQEQIDTARESRQELLINAGIPNSGINDDLIDIIQQIAIWYFTNDDKYKAEEISSIDAMLAGGNYDAIEDVFNDWNLVENDANPEAKGDIYMLFDYFINGGKANKNTAPSTTGTNPIRLTSTGAKAILVGDNYVVGPFKIEELSNIEYTLQGSFKAENGTDISYSLLNSNKQATTKTLKELVGEEFYLKVASSANVEKAKFKVSSTIIQNTITFWTIANSNNEQPVAELVKAPKSFEEEVTVSLSEFDLALRKFITNINGTELVENNGKYTREPNIDLSPLVNNTETTANYKHPKNPLSVEIGDIVVYTLRIYNEGNASGYAAEVTDYLPKELQFVANDELNNSYGWSIDSTGRVATTTKLSKANGTSNLINAFDGTNLDYKELKIKCRVISTENLNNVITNIAEITKFTDETGSNVVDRDSSAKNVVLPSDSDLPNYKGKDNKADLTDSNYFYKGQEDDDDFEKLILKEFDLALRKFITKVNNVAVPTREPVITEASYKSLYSGSTTTATKTHTKDPVEVRVGDTVLYTIRIYNEGQVDGYATKVVDYLPSGLSLKANSDINDTYNWSNPSGDGKTIVTDYLADKLLTAQEKDKTPDYEDLEIECVVNANYSQSRQSLKNIAEITECKDRNNQSITDRDSVPNNLTDEQKSNYNPGTSTRGWGYEDDDDYEELVIPGKEFDLALRKFITNINGEELVLDNGKYTREPNIDLTPLTDGTGTTANYKHQKDPIGVSVGDIVIYTLRIYNEGDISGYASSVTDYLPPQLEFVMDDAENFNASYGWQIDSSLRKATTTKLARTTIDPEDNLINAFDGRTLDYKELKIKCRVVSTADLDKIITNIAEVTAFTDLNGAVITDRDSRAANVTLPSDENLPDYKGNASNKSILTDKDYFYKGQEDDDDFEKLMLKKFDLALRKFITAVNEEKVTNRIPVFTRVKDTNGNYIYEHTKEPVEVNSADVVEYTIRIFNEGDIAGYAKEVKDDIPDGLEFLPNNTTNIEYRWIMLDENREETTDASKAKYIVTDYLSKEQEANLGDNLLTEFDSSKTSPDYRDVKAAFKVIAPNSYEGIITNTAEISDDSDEYGNEVKDIDSTPDNDVKTEDDIDVEHIKLSYFDLALRKFITEVKDVNKNTSSTYPDRVPVFSINEGEYTYTHSKVPVDVENGNIVVYTLRVFNEGTKDGYAKEVKDDLPEGLEFLPGNELNKEYRWVMLDENNEETTDVSKAKFIVTDYLSKEQEDATGRDNLLVAFNPDRMESPNYRDVKIAFKVTEPNTSDRILINKAQISDDSDKEGKDIIDKDSTPDKWIEGEDDQDIEKVKVKYFDLALRKWVTEAIVIENGKETITETGHKAEDDPEEVVKVELKESTYNKVVVKFLYKIRITNEGEIAGYCTEISDYIPEGLKFVAADNPEWKEVDGKIVTDILKDTLLQPGDTAEVEVLLTWINGKDNFGLKINTAEISKDKNDSDTPDIDSVPNNKKPGEDDIDDAPVILTVKTGSEINGQIIIIVVAGLAIISAGVILIKKYVL